MKGKCQVCKKPVSEGMCRCETCHDAWLAGWDEGVKAVKAELRDLVYVFTKLTKEGG